MKLINPEVHFIESKKEYLITKRLANQHFTLKNFMIVKYFLLKFIIVEFFLQIWKSWLNPLILIFLQILKAL